MHALQELFVAVVVPKNHVVFLVRHQRFNHVAILDNRTLGCNSNSYSPSHVLTAMGIPTDEIESCVRLSWGAKTDIDALSDSINQLLDVAKGLVF